MRGSGLIQISRVFLYRLVCRPVCIHRVLCIALLAWAWHERIHFSVASAVCGLYQGQIGTASPIV